MGLFFKDKEIGSIYCNVQFKKKEVGMIPEQFLNSIKTEPLVWQGKSVVIKSYRKAYVDDANICLEGAEIIFK